MIWIGETERPHWQAACNVCCVHCFVLTLSVLAVRESSTSCHYDFDNSFPLETSSLAIGYCLLFYLPVALSLASLYSVEASEAVAVRVDLN